MPALSLSTTLLVYAVQWLVFSGAGIAAQLWRRRLTGRGSTALEAVLLGAVVPCALGLIAFAAYFIHPWVGRVFSWAAIGAILGTLAHTYLWPLVSPSARRRSDSTLPALHHRLLLLTLLTGIFYISALFVFTRPTFTGTARERFFSLPLYNEASRAVVGQLYHDAPHRQIYLAAAIADGPLQSGLALVTTPVLHAVGFGLDKECATAAVWFQLLWIPALWVFLRWLGLTEHLAHAGVAAVVFTGPLLFHSTFGLPLLAGAALVLLAFCTFFATEQAIDPRHRWIAGGTLAAFGWLASGSVIFPLLALLPLALLRLRDRWRSWLLALAMFGGLALPWFIYHYGHLHAHFSSFSASDNTLGLAFSDWRHLLTTRDLAAIAARRTNEIIGLFHTSSTWILALAAVPFLAWQFFRRRPAWRDHVRRHGLALVWAMLTLACAWGLREPAARGLAFVDFSVVPLLFLGLLTAWVLLFNRLFFAALAVLQLGLFVLTWMPPGPNFVASVPSPLAIAVAGIAAVLLIAFCADSLRGAPPYPAVSPSPRLSVPPSRLRPFAALLHWFRAPRLTPWALAGFAIFLFLRKPYGLLVPQLYAEDGSIFLAQNDLVGLRALLEPYQGYLHTIPRLLAWIPSRLLDPAWWPTFYNVSAFLLWLAVIARTFSPRLNLPHKVWLAAAFFLGPHTGEVLCCITNLQWVVAFLLIEQGFIAPPTNHVQRFGDLTLLILLGLTGPFVIALGPLLAWRWWRSRSADNLALLLVATACAGVQAWFIIRPGPKFEFPPFVASRFFEVVGQHLLVWPVLGDHLATHLPAALVGFLGTIPVVALLVWSLRPHPRRLLRAQLVAAFLLIMAAGVYRSRPDTWNLGNLVFSDRYFYLPRVLLAWLFILEIDTAQRAVAWCARAILLACALVHVKGYVVRAEPDYRWTENVDPIRRGVPAKIPTLPEGWTMEYLGRPK